MKRTRWMVLTWILVGALAVGVLAGCGKKGEEEAAEPAADGRMPAGGFSGELDPTNKLALATLKLEGTENAVTPAQASEMLPLWEVVVGGSLQGQAETQAVVKQIEAQMTDAQQEAIEAMDLTREDITAWMQEQGVEMPGQPRGEGQDGQGGPGALQNMSEEDRAKMRAEFQDMTAEQRATRMAEMGIQRPEGGAQGGGPGGAARPGGSGGFLVTPVIELLTQRAAE